jgi:hypothetical protein
MDKIVLSNYIISVNRYWVAVSWGDRKGRRFTDRSSSQEGIIGSSTFASTRDASNSHVISMYALSLAETGKYIIRPYVHQLRH